MHHPIAGVVYCYVFFLFMGFTMVNIFLAIIMDSYADVVGEARAVSLATRGVWPRWVQLLLQPPFLTAVFPLQNGAHTIIQDIQKYRQVFSTSTLNPFPNHIFAKGTAVDYKEATTYAKDPLVRSLALVSLSVSRPR